MCLIRAVSASILGVGLLVGCARGDVVEPVGHDAPVYGGTFVYADESDIRTLDPAIGYDEQSWTAGYLVFDRLLTYNDDMKIEGELAESWTVSEDGRVWTFHLRPQARFQDWTNQHGERVGGRPMLASDVVFSWTRMFDPSLGSPGADFYGVIEGAQAVLNEQAQAVSGLVALDEHTLQVTLSQPDASFADVVAMMFGAVVLPEAVADRGERWMYSPVGTGPFSVESWSLGEKTVFKAHRGYWREGLPYLDEIVHLARYPRPVQFLKLEAGELHQVNRLTSPDYLWVKRDPVWSQRLQEIASVDTYAEAMNTEVEPFTDLTFRRAVSTAIDRDKLKKLRNGRMVTAVGFLPPGMDGHVEWEQLSQEDKAAFRYQRYDPDLSRQLLAQAGYPDGYPEPIEYWTLTDEGSLVTALSIQQDLAQVGIELEIRNTTFPAYLTATGKRGQVQMAYTAWVMDYPDARNFLEPKFSCDSRAEENSTNETFYCNAEVDRLLAAAAVEPDRQRRQELYHQAHRIIASEAPMAFEYHSVSVSVTRPEVRDFVVHPVRTRDMGRAWLDLPGGRTAP